MKTMKTSPVAREAPQNFAVGTGESGNLFAGGSFARRGTAMKRSLAIKRSLTIRRGLAPELAAARVLCRQLRRKRMAAEKKRLAHLICLNLLAILKRRSQQA